MMLQADRILRQIPVLFVFSTTLSGYARAIESLAFNKESCTGHSLGSAPTTSALPEAPHPCASCPTQISRTFLRQKSGRVQTICSGHSSVKEARIYPHIAKSLTLRVGTQYFVFFHASSAGSHSPSEPGPGPHLKFLGALSAPSPDKHSHSNCGSVAQARAFLYGRRPRRGISSSDTIVGLGEGLLDLVIKHEDEGTTGAADDV